MVGTLKAPIGQYAPDFELPGVDGDVHHLTQYLANYQAIGVVIMSNHCPYVRQSLEYLKQLQSRLAPQRFTLIGINGNETTPDGNESVEEMLQLAQTYHLNFPYLRDKTQDVLRTFKANTTPDVFLLDHYGIVRYSGAIMVVNGGNMANMEPSSQVGLEKAIAQLLAGQSITTPRTTVHGTPIKWRSP